MEALANILVNHNSIHYGRRVAARLVGVTEIARMLGVSQQRASQIIDAYDDFPPPAAFVGTRRAWHGHDVEQWIARHPDRGPGRPRRTDDGEGDA